jgi:hypothetical protein
MFDPATTPAIDGLVRRRVFLSHIYRRPNTATYRGSQYTVCSTVPSAARKMSLAGYTQEVPDLEIMIALADGSPEPVSLGADGVTIAAKEYRIISVQKDIAPDCYQLSLSLRN